MTTIIIFLFDEVFVCDCDDHVNIVIVTTMIMIMLRNQIVTMKVERLGSDFCKGLLDFTASLSL